MLPTVLFTFGFAVVAASAYDFNDENFNQFLSSELTDWSELARVRRSPKDNDKSEDSDDKKNSNCHPPGPHHGKPHGPPHGHHWHSCCGNGKWMKNFGVNGTNSDEECVKEYHDRLNSTGKDDHPLLMESVEDMFSCAKVNMKKMKVVCITECVGKKSGLLTEDGNLISQKLRAYIVNDFFQENWSKVIAEGVVDKCIQSTNSTSWKTAETGDIKCNPAMLSFKHCLWTHIEKNCPEYQRNQDPRCKDLFKLLDTKKSSNMSHV